ncbi:hypothetical protein DYB32_009778 [Aphanomyces invadans]|uniref:Retroviral polymerase SH3-like domain-containing protein n=1 Tax=Aphanomyces invadans TaxID=157072 RepID=A0A418AHK0_9STRA|nr:hypothetical protein DYB32_009778 [Aphanomyces invadans]
MFKAPERHNKLAPKATLCIMVGYTENMKAYKLLDVENQKIIHGVQVRFLKNEFFGEPDLPEQIDDNDDSDSENDAPESGQHVPSHTATPPSMIQTAMRRASSTIAQSAAQSTRLSTPSCQPLLQHQGTLRTTQRPRAAAPTRTGPSIDKAGPAHAPEPQVSMTRGAKHDNPRQIMFKLYQDPVAHPAARSSRLPAQAEESLRSSFQSLRDNNEPMINRLEDNPTTSAPTRRNATEVPSAPTRASSRLRKPNPRYLNFAANEAERPLDTSLEGYHQEEIQEDSATYRIGNMEFACATVPIQLHPVPNSHKEAMASPDWRHWKAVMRPKSHSS